MYVYALRRKSDPLFNAGIRYCDRNDKFEKHANYFINGFSLPFFKCLDYYFSLYLLVFRSLLIDFRP